MIDITKHYMIDSEPVDPDELIKRAKNLGYDGDMYGVFYTSGATRVLRGHGHLVENNPHYKKTNSKIILS